MNDVEKVSSSPASSKPRTPAYGNFDSNTDKLHHLLTLMNRGIKGIGQEFADDLRKTRIECGSAMADDINAAGQVGNITGAIESLVDQVIAPFSGIIVVVEWMPVMIVTTVEAYLMDVLAYAAGIDPTLMERSEQSASYAELTTASSLEEVMTELRYRWARNFLDKGGPRSWVERLTKMGARAYRPETAQEMETLWGMRHLVVHAAGVATVDFTRRHPHLGIQVGERVRVRLPQVQNWFEQIYHFVDVTDTYFIQRCRL